mgnify:CR=1 FL=1
MELFKRAVSESNIKPNIKAGLIKHLEECKCGPKISKAGVAKGKEFAKKNTAS